MKHSSTLLSILLWWTALLPGTQFYAADKLADNRPLKINRLTADHEQVEIYDVVEFTAEIAASYDNPFDPGQIAVDAQVTTPDGKVLSVPGFLYAPMQMETGSTWEHVKPSGSPDFRVRYTPATAGNHRLILQVTDRSGTVKSEPITIRATKGNSSGFIRAGRSSQYFTYDNGKPYFAVGENLCWANHGTPIAEYTKWLQGLGAAGGNWVRLWLAYNEKGLEWMPAPTPKGGTGTYQGLGRYALDNAWRLDEVVRLARTNGVNLMFCIGTYGEFTEGGYFGEGSWVSNPYNAKNGGPCATAKDFWTNAQARKLYQQRLRYLIARWGYASNLFAWEFWNEVPATPVTDTWIAEMAAFFKQHDPNHHLVSTTYGTAQTWRCPDLDFTMQHFYGQAGNIADFTPPVVRDALTARDFNKPHLLAEFGIDWQTADTRWDPKGDGLNLHNTLWASALSGAAGTAMIWYWDGYVHPHNLYHVFTPVRRFADTVDWTKAPLTPITHASVTSTSKEPEIFSELTLPATVEWGVSKTNEYTINRDGAIEGEPIAMTLGSPKRGRPGELFSRLIWHLDLPQAGKVTLRLGRVSNRAHLVVSVDGETRVNRELLAGEPGKGPWKSANYYSEYKIWNSDYDEDIPVEMPAGKHTLTVANSDGDWLQIRSLHLPAYRSSRYPNVNVVGLQNDNLILLWVQNRESTWRTTYDGHQPHTLADLRISLPVPEAGNWRIEWWDTFKGEVSRRETVRAQKGALVVAPAPFATDLAIRAEKVR